MAGLLGFITCGLPNVIDVRPLAWASAPLAYLLLVVAVRSEETGARLIVPAPPVR
jgi:hypothetical protein